MCITPMVNTTRAYAGGVRTAKTVRDTVVAELTGAPMWLHPNIVTALSHLAIIQQLRVNTDITSHETGKSALDRLEDILYTTMFDTREDDPIRSVTNATMTARTNTEYEIDTRNTINTSIVNNTQKTPANINHTYAYINLTQQLRMDTDIISYTLGRTIINHLEDILYKTLSDMEYRAKEKKDSD